MSRHYGTTASRGYGTAHQKLRKQWKPMVDAGQVQCYAELCLEERDGRSRWIAPGARWHLGHTPDRSGWTGPEHERCGASDGARRGNQNRPWTIVAALGPTRSPRCKVCGKEYHYAAKQCMICGRHYHPSRGVQYTCSRQCGAVYQRMNRPAPPPPKPKLQPSPRECESCGVTFVAIGAKRYCSAKCNSTAYYAANREAIIAGQLARYYARDGRVAPPPQERVRIPLDGTATRPRGGRCTDCGRQVWRSETNRVDDGWACASCRRKRATANGARTTGMMTAHQSRDW